MRLVAAAILARLLCFVALDEFGDEIGYDISAKMWGKIKLKGKNLKCTDTEGNIIEGKNLKCEDIAKQKVTELEKVFEFKDGNAQRLLDFITHRLHVDDDATIDQNAYATFEDTEEWLKHNITTFEDAKEWLKHNINDDAAVERILKLPPKGGNGNAALIVPNPAFIPARELSVDSTSKVVKTAKAGKDSFDSKAIIKAKLKVVKTAIAGMQSCPDCWAKKGHFGTKIIQHDYSKISKSIASSSSDPSLPGRSRV